MLTSKIFLPDVNFWLAVASRRHIHAKLCSDWLESISSNSVFFCRVTQMGLLRLLTNQAVMGEDDVITARNAWRAYRAILADERISFAPEPFSLELRWKKLTDQDKSNTKLWTDAYLAAFAITGAMQLVTLDRAMQAIAPDALVLK